jgi:hypothetical protein
MTERPDDSNAFERTPMVDAALALGGREANPADPPAPLTGLTGAQLAASFDDLPKTPQEAPGRAQPPEPEQSPDELPSSHPLADPGSLFSAENEEEAIACVLTRGRPAFEEAGIKSDVFYIQKNRWTWERCENLYADGLEIDPPAVAAELERAGHLEDCGGRFRLDGLFASCASGLFVASNARILRDYAVRRRMLADASDLARRAVDLKIPPPESMTQPARKTRWNISELLSTDFPDPTGPIPGIIPIGLTVLGGRPKRGKSWLMLQCAYSLAIGGKFLDHDLAINRVLYYALEDSPRRLKDRLAKFNPDPSALIEFERELKPLHLGGLEQIDQTADHHYLIVIDTLGRAMPGKDFTKDGALFADVLGRLQGIAQAKNNSIVGILHTRKPTGLEHDPIDDILGSTGMTAAPDCVLALYKEQGKAGARLEGRGRDFDDIDLMIEFDPLTCAWQLIGATDDVRMSDDEAEILEAMPDLGKAKVSTIAKAIGKDRGNMSKRCVSLWTKGMLKKEVLDGVTYYYLPTLHTHTTQGTQGTQDTQAV